MSKDESNAAMIDLPNFDPIKIGDEIAALESEAQDKLAEAKGEFVSRSEKIAAILWEVEQNHPEHLDAICERARIGRTRRYELLQIGSGRKSVKQSRQETVKRQKTFKAKKKESVTVTDSAPKQPQAKQPKEDTNPPRSSWPSAEDKRTESIISAETPEDPNTSDGTEEIELGKVIARLRRDQPRNTDTMRVCDALERCLKRP